MSSSAKQKIYEIRDGPEVLGQFSVKTKAMSFKKQCSSEGRRVKVYTRFIDESEKRPEPKPVPKIVPKPAPKEVPKAVPKTVPKESPRKASVPKVPRAERPTVPKDIPMQTSDDRGSIDGRTLKSLAKLMKALKNTEVPIYDSEFHIIDPAHIAILSVSVWNGRSLFGFQPNGSFTGVDIADLAGKCSASSVYSTSTDGKSLILDDGRSTAQSYLLKDVFSPRPPVLGYGMEFDVDADAFDTELRRVKGVLKGNRNTKEVVEIALNGEGGDLFMSGERGGYALRADIGDGDIGPGARFDYAYLRILADMFMMSDRGSRCRLYMDRDMPLEGTCYLGRNLELSLMIAPLREE